jgi:hypothetical protein
MQLEASLKKSKKGKKKEPKLDLFSATLNASWKSVIKQPEISSPEHSWLRTHTLHW